MESYKFLLDLALILLSTKVLGLVTKKFKMPQVVGALLAGLLLGPAMLNVLNETEFIISLSEVGVILLMFAAGLESDIGELKKTGKASLIIAILGVIVPLVGGFAIAYIFNKPGIIDSNASANIFLQNIFIGVILTATSVSITVETLKELGKLNTNVGNAILGAAIIDDILGIIALTIITSLADTAVNVGAVLFKIFAFFVFAIIAGYVFYFIFHKIRSRYQRDLRRFVILAFVFCLLMAYSSEVFFGVADITGAYIAGLVLSNSKSSKFISNKFETVSYVLLSPIFFASIGLKVELPKMTFAIILFSILLVFVAIITKIIGCGLGAKICSFSNKESIQIGSGMVSRGEVALIVASKGAALGLMSSALFGPVIIVVVATTIISPILLKIAFKTKKNIVKKNNNEVSKLSA
ncbi:sodium/proton-potassium antiporter GerN (CPA2 family) [Mobilisporobacter senegalensis]|uniref:Sodium/proton-potassium antiporter GerN (CPA2 family) n=1 Tax=Mobilisporobacter senegalensis TaxID=1329262 RepID=A0A3N1XYU3_9FIRM|nr:cation:proton antiporter [Mobilisporobacter senegalensis]ROR31411.1 sodium/proton-potassium antiporter GerN (CPA2 family) [Mobilisporobacter senegalensis]